MTLSLAQKPAATAPGRLLVWGGFALVLLLAPWAVSGGLALSILSQIGIAIVACLSYNILLGQGGMLSFGHAVYTGLASFVAIHALNQAGQGGLPVSLIPLVGGLAGAGFAIVLGFVTTRKAGTPFAMITLGIAELVFAMALMVPEFFGGEGGVSGNRVVGHPFMGITFGPPIQVYYLLALYAFLCTAAMFAFTRTPLGRMLNAVRDNPERVEFVGYSTQRVRYLSFIIAGFFAGVSGGMYALHFEIATAEVVGAARSGAYLLFTFLGGATFFFGPIIGAVLMVLAGVLLSELTKAWLLYLGLVFLLMVMYAPGGVASLIMMNVRVAVFGRLRELLPTYAGLAAALAVTLLGAGAVVEMIYHLQLNDTAGSELGYLGLQLSVGSALHWLAALAVLAAGLGLLEALRRPFLRRWAVIQQDIEAAQRRRQGA
jgi:branched-chain amino acid transport system permease protein